MINETLKLTGQVTVLLNGKVVHKINNLVVTDGKEYVASRIKDASSTVMSHMAVGTSSTVAGSSDSALGAETGRVALTSTTVAGAAVTYAATFPAGTGSGALAEAAILNGSSGGTMLCRTVFSVVNKQAADAMTIQWTVSAS
jgi:hypothetical protein